LRFVLKNVNTYLKCAALNPKYGNLDYIDLELREKIWKSLEDFQNLLIKI
jgi:hypothetical protein